MAEVSDSIHLRRFCRISLRERVPDESTVAEADQADRGRDGGGDDARVDREGAREKRFRPRAVRIDSTVIEADVQLSDRCGVGLQRGHGAGQGGPQARRADRGARSARVRDRSRSMGRKLRAITRTIRRRSGEAKAEVLKLTGETGEMLERSIKEARRLAAIARRKARGRGATREGEGGRRVGGDGGSLREGRQADPPACRGRADHRPARVDVRSGRPADPQGQAREAQPVPIARLCRDDARAGGARPACARILRLGAGGFVGIVTGLRGTRGACRVACSGRV